MALALFDFDGTLTTRDTFRPFLRLAIPPARLIAGGLALSPILLGHQLGVVTSAQARPWLSWAGLAGVPAARVRTLGEQYASNRLSHVIEHSMLARLQAHQRKGDTVFVVSAGLDSYLRPWCRAHGVGLVCTELDEQHGVLTGRYRRGDCSGKNKATLIRADIPLHQFSNITAYGDTVEDLDMLALAHRRFYRGVELSGGGMSR